MTRDTWHPRDTAAALLRHRRWIVVASVIGLILGAAYALTRDSYYVANSSIVAGGRSQGIAGQLGGLAARLGVDVGGGGDAASPAFAAGILSSPPVMHELATSVGLGTTELQKRLRVLPVPPSGIIRVEGRGETEAEADRLVRNWIMIADSMARNIRQQRALQEGTFLDNRLQNVRTQLTQAESRLERFHEENRMFESPSLRVREARLQREVQMHTAVFQQLSELYESARIEQFRDTPTFALLGDIVLEEHDSSPATSGLAGAVLAGLLAVAGVVMWSFLKRGHA